MTIRAGGGLAADDGPRAGGGLAETAPPPGSPPPPAWSPFVASGTYVPPDFYYDTALSPIIQDAEHAVSSIGDVRPSVAVAALSPAGEQPVLGVGPALDGRPGLGFTAAGETKMKADIGGAPIGTGPCAIFEISTVPSDAPPYSTLATIGGSQPLTFASPYTLANVPLLVLGRESSFGEESGSIGGHGHVLSRRPLNARGAESVPGESLPPGSPPFTPLPTARLVTWSGGASPGSLVGGVLRVYVDGAQVAEWTIDDAALSWAWDVSASNDFQIGGAYEPTYAPKGTDEQKFAGGAWVGSAPAPADVGEFSAWVATEYPSLRQPRRLIVVGASGDLGVPWSSTMPHVTAPTYLATQDPSVTETWDALAFNFAENGATVGYTNAQFTLSMLWGAGGAGSTNPDSQGAAQWNAYWSVSKQAVKNVVVLGYGMILAELIARTNDGQDASTAAAGTYADLQLLAQQALDAGADAIVATTATDCRSSYSTNIPLLQSSIAALRVLMLASATQPIASGGLGASYLVDTFPTFDDATDTTKFYTDFSHLTEFGYGLLGGLYAPVLVALG